MYSFMSALFLFGAVRFSSGESSVWSYSLRMLFTFSFASPVISRAFLE